jgi:GPH family glycoside/pentoside/hexuronide:cation symporter
MNPPPSRISHGATLAYGLPAFFLAVVGIPVYVYLPKFYTDVVGVDIALTGHVLLAARLFDAVTDPLLGLASDRTRTPFGRRRPYIAAGSVLLAASLYQLFTPPAGGGAAWLGGWLFALFLFWTVVTVPYESLGPELTFDYNERTRLFAVRDGLLIAGTLAAAASPALFRRILGLPETPVGERRLFFWIAAVYAPLVMASCWYCVLRLRERPPEAVGPALPRMPGRRRDGAWTNRPFRILLASYTISALGSNLPATLILYYVEYVLHSHRADLFLFLYFMTGIAFLPAWTLVSRRIGKKGAWLGAMAINTLAFVGVFFLGPGDETAYGVLVVASGIGFGASLALPSSIQADVIDYDELRTGNRREGRYVGLWTVSKKLAAAVGVGAGLVVLGWAGYVPGKAQPPEVVTSLRVLYALVPCLCNLLAFAIALSYPIGPKVHDDIRKAIARRKRGETVEDPLAPGIRLPGMAPGAPT